LRLCYIADARSVHVQRWVNYFARKGHEVHLICWKPMPGYDENIHVHLLTRLAPKTSTVSQYLSALLWIFQARRSVKKIKPDIVDGHFITSYGFLAACSGFHPLVVSAWGSDVLILPKHNPFFKALTRYALTKADVVTCDSEVAREGLMKLGVEQAKIRVIFKGVDTQQFGPQHRSQELREKLGIYEAPTVISIRNLEPIYNVEMLIRAIPLALSQVPEAKFIIGSDGTLRTALTNLADSLGVSDSIRFVGWVSHHELPQLLASSDIYVSTSLSDTSHISLQEAMACELAPVVTDIPANRAWIEDGKNGFLVSIGDTQLLADKIIYLIRNEQAQEEFAKANRQIIQQKDEYEKEMAKMETIYGTLKQGIVPS
jgi:glycosyltransferase involved in cell wall biosynthesis